MALVATGCASTEELYARYDQPACLIAPPTPVIAPAKLLSWHWAVLFAYNSHDISEDQARLLRNNLKLLKANTDYRVVLRGFTDSVASQRFNLKLSHQRVDAVGQWFTGQGIADDRIERQWLGKDLPLTGQGDRQHESVNRRVELLLMDGDGNPVSFESSRHTLDENAGEERPGIINAASAQAVMHSHADFGSVAGQQENFLPRRVGE